MRLAGPPPPGTPVPDAITALAAGAGGEAEPVWQNQLGGLAFRLPGERYAKWAPAGSRLDLAAERVRLQWAASYSPVPRVLGWGDDAAGSWLMTAALPGRSAVDPVWLARPEIAVHALGEGLRRLHDALPVAECPFDWSVDFRLAYARGEGLSPDPGLAALAPPIDRLVVCHGDSCVPNTLIGEDGRWSGHVDFGALGVADRWADLAVATESTEWNYGADWTREFLAAYGVEQDLERIDYYRAVWNAT